MSQRARSTLVWIVPVFAVIWWMWTIVAPPLLAKSIAPSRLIFNPQLLTGAETFDGQPTMWRGTDGTLWVSWVAYTRPQGDLLMAASRTKGKWSEPEQITPNFSQIVRPTLCQSGNEAWAFWTETGAGVSRIMYASRSRGKWPRERASPASGGQASVAAATGTWSEPRTFSTIGVAAQNQEVAVDSHGRLFVVWQEFHDGQYDVMLRSLSDGQWSKTTAITQDRFDDWDPAVVCDARGRVWVAWSSYREGDYDIYLRRADVADAPEMRLSERGEYDLHPSLAADRDGRVWVAWDSVVIPNHGWSGNSTITGANLKTREKAQADRGWPPLTAGIRLVCVDGETTREIAGATEALTPPVNYRLAHTALPKIAVGKDGTLWVAYRALGHTLPQPQPVGSKKVPSASSGLHQQKPPAQPKAQPARSTGSRSLFWWDVFVQSYRSDGWSEPLKLPDSDGTLEEVALTTEPDSLAVAYQMEHRIQALAKGIPNLWAQTEEHHGDYGKVLGCNGDVYFAGVQARRNGRPASTALVARTPLPDKKVKPRLPRENARYEIQAGNQHYMLLWGDLHKHSNISRCSSGSEASPDDHYKYAHDICQYDFLCMSDHSEHTSDYNWWSIQKLADLYDIPGSFSVLYGYEWTARWPIGHHNCVFPERPAPILRSNLEGAKTTHDLWASLDRAGVKALTIPHTLADPGMGTRWDDHDERYERIAEIFQACRGSYEHDGCPRQHANATKEGCFYQDGLAKDYRMGIICSSDHGWGTAYTVAYATENSRRAAFDALWDRRCYGSTTYGLVVDFRADGHLMGEEFNSTKPPEISVYARGTAPLRSIEIISQGKVIHAVGDVKNPIAKNETHIVWQPPEQTVSTAYYYARIIQENDEMAWTSPVWVHSKPAP